MSQGNTIDIGSVFGSALATGDISPATHTLLSAPDLGARIQAGLGVPADLFQHSEAFFSAMLLDDSTSIRMAGNTQVVRDGGNIVIEALRGSKTNAGILMAIELLNRGRLVDAAGKELGFVSLDQIPLIDGSNYEADGGTPLYDRSIDLLGLVLAKSEEYRQNGIDVRSSTLIVTDGRDEHSIRKVHDLRAPVLDMQRSERHIVAFMGIARVHGNGRVNQDDVTYYRDIAQQMGIEDRWILTPGSTATEIRRAFQQFSRSSVQASQGAAGHSQAFRQGFKP